MQVFTELENPIAAPLFDPSFSPLWERERPQSWEQVVGQEKVIRQLRPPFRNLRPQRADRFRAPVWCHAHWKALSMVFHAVSISPASIADSIARKLFRHSFASRT